VLYIYGWFKGGPCYDVQHYAYDLIICPRTRPCTALLSSWKPWHKTRSKWCRLHWCHPHKWQGTFQGGTWTTSAHRWDDIFYSWTYSWPIKYYLRYLWLFFPRQICTENLLTYISSSHLWPVMKHLCLFLFNALPVHKVQIM
jgi:hypothetical protein